MSEQQTSTDDGAAAGAAAGAGGGAAAGAAAAVVAGDDKPWYAALPDDIRENPVLTGKPSLEDAARHLISLQGRFGVPADQLLRLPKDGDEKAMGEVFNRLGRPETVDKYDVKLPEGSPLDDAALNSFLATMHPKGMTRSQAEAAATWYGNYAKQVEQQATEAITAQRAQNETALKGEWGAAYDDNLKAAAEAAQHYGGKDYQRYLEDSGMGDDPRTLKAWAAVAKDRGEAGFGHGERGRDPGGQLTPAEARAERLAWEAKPEIAKALNDGNTPGREAILERRLQLIAMERPTPAAKA